MEKRTIGGIPIREVFQKLQENIPGVLKETDSRRQPYLDMEVLRQYFNRHIPIENYDFLISDVQFVQAENAACFVCVGTLTVYDDDGNRVISKSYIGSSDCPRRSDTKEFLDFAMSAKNAAVNARKNCIALYGCGKAQLENAKAGKKRKGGTSGAPSGQRGTRPAYGNASFPVVLDPGRESRMLPSMSIIPVKLPQHGNFETYLLIWRQNFKNPDAIIAQIQKEQEFTCWGKFESVAGNHRIVFKAFERKCA